MNPAAAAAVLASGALAFGALAADAGPAAAQQPALGFAGASLGDTLDAWKALPAPAGLDGSATPVCSTDTRLAAIPASPLRVSDQGPDAVVCGYGAIYGRTVLLRSAPLDKTFRARNLRYVFDGGRLAEIRFETSVDAFDDVNALLGRSYGPPSSIRRSQVKDSGRVLPRVRETWIVPGGGAIRVVDPDNPVTRLSVSFISPQAVGAPQRLAGGGAAGPTS